MKLVRTAVMITATALAFAAPAAYAQNDAAALYKSRCQVCHGPDGKGDTAVGKKVGAKDFHSPEVVKMSDSELFEITKKGKEKMPSYDKKLTDDQIKELIKFIHTLK